MEASANAEGSLTQNIPHGCVRPQNNFIPFPSEAIEQTIYQRFEAIVRANPERLALRVGAETVSYAELEQKAGRLANALFDSIRSGREQIALLARPGMTLVVGLLATLKAGGICVPLDPSYPPGRIQRILEDAQAGAVIVEDKNPPEARWLGQHYSVLSLEDSSHESAGEGVYRDAETPCFLLYTSGSTGRPKGVVYNHRDFLHLVKNTTNSLHIAPEDRISLLASSGTIAAQEDIFRALLNGASLFPFSVPEHGLMRLPQWLLEEEITVYHSVPTLFRHFAAGLSGSENYPKLRLIQLGGEAVYQRDVELYRKNFADNCLLVTGLGSTEVANIAHYFFDKNTSLEGAVAPAGYAAADREILLLDDAGRAVEAGEVGEIAVKSRYLSRGYWRRPDLTAAAFYVATDDPSAAVYRTGDLGRMTEDGCLLHLGRKDFMVKIHGRRVEVAEVETALFQVPDIADAAVIAQQDDAHDKRLAAYLVPRPTAELSVGQLRRRLQASLPDYMIPSAFVMLDAMPLTATGKIDRAALLSRGWPRVEVTNAVVQSREPIEKMLTDIWTELLGFRPSGDNDSFFDLGGDSLSAILLLAEIEKRTGIRVPPGSFLQAPTIKELASVLSQPAEPIWAPFEAIQADGFKLPFFVSGSHPAYAEFKHQLGTEQPIYRLNVYALLEECLRQSEHFDPDLKAIGGYFVQFIRTIQPSGPYYLGGSCEGAIIAFEIAQQLQQQGEDIGLLVLWDACLPRSWGALQYYLHRLRTVRRQGLGHLPSSLPKKLTKRRRARRNPFAHLDDILFSAMHGYRPRAYPGRITILKSQEQPSGFWPHDPALGWRRWANGGVEMHVVPGANFALLTEQAAQLAVQVEILLATASKEHAACSSQKKDSSRD